MIEGFEYILMFSELIQVTQHKERHLVIEYVIGKFWSIRIEHQVIIVTYLEKASHLPCYFKCYPTRGTVLKQETETCIKVVLCPS